MQSLQTPRKSSPRYIAEPWSIKLSIQDAREQTASRHDSQMLTERPVPIDPYKAWLEQREGDRRSSAVPV
jgi:hypothetical protein